MDGGSTAIRGFYLQTWVDIFEMIKDTNWVYIEMEPKEDKIDIYIFFEDERIKVIQVKSTKNYFYDKNIRNILRSMIDASLNATYYELVLIGNTNANTDKIIEDIYIEKEINKLEQILNIRIVPFNIEEIEKSIEIKLQEYLENLGYELQGEALKVIHKFLISDALLYAIKKDRYYRKDFDEKLLVICELIPEKDYRYEVNISAAGFKHYKKTMFIRKVLVVLTIFLSVNPLIKLYLEGLTIIDIVCISEVILFLVFGIMFFKKSDDKFRKKEEKELEEYASNKGVAENDVLKICVNNETEYENMKRQEYIVIRLKNKTKDSIKYIEGKIQFKHVNEVLYEYDFYKSGIEGNESIILFDRRIPYKKSSDYWTHFKVNIKKIKFGEEELKMEIYSQTKYRTYYTLLNSHYLPIIGELLHYESTFAVNLIREKYCRVCYLIRNITVKVFCILFFCVSISILLMIGFFIGITNFLFVPIKVITEIINLIL